MQLVSTSKRLQYIDVAKGFGMLAIIAGHMGYPIIERIVFTFHVPIFFFICGYLYKHKQPSDRIRHLIKPYLITAFVLTFLTDVREFIKSLLHRSDAISVIENTWNYIKATVYGSGVRTDFLWMNLKPIGAIWFLLALMLSLLLFDLIIKIFNRNLLTGCVFILTTVVVGFFSSMYIWLPLSVQSAAIGVLIIGSGYFLKRSSLQIGNRILTICCLLLWGTIIYKSIKYGNMSMAENRYPSPIIDYLGCICASYAVLSILSLIEKCIVSHNSRLWNWICVLGRKSTAVLCVHLIEIRVFPWHIVKHENSTLAFIFIYIIKIVIATLTAYYFNRYKSRKACI